MLGTSKRLLRCPSSADFGDGDLKSNEAVFFCIRREMPCSGVSSFLLIFGIQNSAVGWVDQATSLRHQADAR